MNKRLRLAVRNAACTDCKMSRDAEDEDICITGSGKNEATVGVITQFPVSPDSHLRAQVEEAFLAHGIDLTTVVWLSAIKCRTYSASPSKADLKACRKYLDMELDFLKLEYVITLGSEALFAGTGRSGIVKWRGQIHTHSSGAKVFSTISPSAVVRNPGMASGFNSDIRVFCNMVRGIEGDEDPWHLPYDDQWTNVITKADLKALSESLETADAVSFDIESTTGSEFDPDAAIVSLSLTTLHGDQPHVWAIPLFHPDSPWLDRWQRVLRWLAKFLCKVPKRIAHNAKFDTRWLIHFGMPNLLPTFDTIIATSLLDENRRKGLKPLAQELLGADPWAMEGNFRKDWWLHHDLLEILDYNGLDTWHTMRLYLLFRAQLKEQPRLERLMRHLMMPVIRELVFVERRGVYVDRPLMMKNWGIAQQKLIDFETELAEALPHPDEVPDRLKHKKTGEILVNYNASNFLRWWLFDFLQLPVIKRGKMKDDGRSGDPSVAEDVMMALAPQSSVCSLLLERVEWNKYDTAFFSPYSEQVTDDSRLRTVFKPWGTVTGRMSSGKEDAEKITSKAQLRGANLQQVPRNKLVRGIFGAAPGWAFVEADYSQIELRIAAYLAREITMLHLYATGQDIHMAMAMQMTGKPAHLVTAEERKRAKAINFGFLYGMGWAKFIVTAFIKYGILVTPDESKAFRKAFFQQFPGLLPWHGRQRSLAAKYKRVESPLGRVRHLPDIDSHNPEVRSEAERQAINSPVQGFASDLALLSLVHTAKRFRREGIEAYPIGAVHDAVNFEIRIDDLPRALPLIKYTMENLPLEKLFGVHLDVPIVADLKVGSHWGGATEIPAGLLKIHGGDGADTQLIEWLMTEMNYDLEGWDGRSRSNARQGRRV